MATSVVVVPRERFGSLPVSLRSLFSTVAPDVPVVVVEGATPPDTRAELQALSRERPFELLSLPFMVKPNEARNIGVGRTDTEYVVIADNDIEYEPGWLQALEEHAVEHDSDAVAPLICIGPPAATIVHDAGGVLTATRRESGDVRVGEAHRLMDVPLAEAASKLPPVENHRFRRWVVARLERRVVEQQLALRGQREPNVPMTPPREPWTPSSTACSQPTRPSKRVDTPARRRDGDDAVACRDGAPGACLAVAAGRPGLAVPRPLRRGPVVRAPRTCSDGAVPRAG